MGDPKTICERDGPDEGSSIGGEKRGKNDYARQAENDSTPGASEFYRFHQLVNEAFWLPILSRKQPFARIRSVFSPSERDRLVLPDADSFTRLL